MDDKVAGGERERAGVDHVAQRRKVAVAYGRVSVPTDKGANADLKTMSLVAGMCAGADSIQGMSILHHGGMRKTFDYCYAPSTLGTFVRQFTFGHVRQRVPSRHGSSPRSPRRRRCSPGSTTWHWSTSTTPSWRSTAMARRVRRSATPVSAD